MPHHDQPDMGDAAAARRGCLYLGIYGIILLVSGISTWFAWQLLQG